MNIAYSTNRTLIMPPLLPHIGSRTNFKFGGRPGRGYKEANKVAIKDGEVVMGINRTEFPSWSEILDYGLITAETGVYVMDIWEFMRTNYAGSLLYQTVGIDDMPAIISWSSFIDEFNTQFENVTVARIGSAFALKDIDDAFKLYDEIAFERIRRATLCFSPSNKLLDLLRASIIHIPNHYVGVHIRFGDTYKLMKCNETKAEKEFIALISSIRNANITKGSAVYLASKDDNAKRCFDGHSGSNFKVFALNDITNPLPTDEKLGVFNVSAVVPSFTDAMNEINLDMGTKYLLVDLMLVSLGQSYFFSRVSFRPKSSTLQMIIEQRHEFRENYLRLILS